MKDPKIKFVNHGRWRRNRGTETTRLKKVHFLSILNQNTGDDLAKEENRGRVKSSNFGYICSTKMTFSSFEILVR
jgi:hypothetical protein